MIGMRIIHARVVKIHFIRPVNVLNNPIIWLCEMIEPVDETGAGAAPGGSRRPVSRLPLYATPTRDGL